VGASWQNCTQRDGFLVQRLHYPAQFLQALADREFWTGWWSCAWACWYCSCFEVDLPSRENPLFRRAHCSLVQIIVRLKFGIWWEEVEAAVTWVEGKLPSISISGSDRSTTMLTGGGGVVGLWVTVRARKCSAMHNFIPFFVYLRIQLWINAFCLRHLWFLLNHWIVRLSVLDIGCLRNKLHADRRSSPAVNERPSSACDSLLGIALPLRQSVKCREPGGMKCIKAKANFAAINMRAVQSVVLLSVGLKCMLPLVEVAF